MKKYLNVLFNAFLLVSILSGCSFFKQTPVTMNVNSTYINFHTHEGYVFKDVSVEEVDGEIVISFKAYLPKD